MELYYEYLCEQYLKELAPDLHKRYCNSITHLLEELDNYQMNFPSFTDHTMLHSVNIINYCNALIAENIKHLNADEIYVLLMSAYLHDSGMGISKNDYETFCRNIGIENYSKAHTPETIIDVIRDYHHEFSGEFVKKYAHQFDIPSEYVFAIVQISRGHRKTNLYDEKEYPSKYTLSNGNAICLPYLAALLRLADEIDVAVDRNSLPMYEKKYNSISDKIFNMHRAIQRISIEQESFVMKFDVKGNLKLYDDIMQLKRKMEQTLSECRDVIHRRTSFVLSQKEIIVIGK